MSNWKHRLAHDLEPILRAPDPRPQLSAYHDMPCAIFRYEPEHELAVRKELRLMATRLRQQAGKQVTCISLADCLTKALERANITTRRLATAEARTGVGKVVDTVHTVLSKQELLETVVIEDMPADPEPTRDIVFIHRAGALFPFYRMSTLLDHFMGRVQVPVVLFYPGTTDGPTGLIFMGIGTPDSGNYRPKIF